MQRKQVIRHLVCLGSGKKMGLGLCALGLSISLANSLPPFYPMLALTSVLLPQFYHFHAEKPWFPHL